MDYSGYSSKGKQLFQRLKWMLTDGCGRFCLPSHGGNTGSNPVGDANNINKIAKTKSAAPKIFPKRRR
jgi:hypothetical protein